MAFQPPTCGLAVTQLRAGAAGLFYGTTNYVLRAADLRGLYRSTDGSCWRQGWPRREAREARGGKIRASPPRREALVRASAHFGRASAIGKAPLPGSMERRPRPAQLPQTGQGSSARDNPRRR